MSKKFKFKVITPFGQHIIPCDKNITIKELKEIIDKRINRTPNLQKERVTHLYNDNFLLFEDDLVAEVLNNDDIISSEKINHSSQPERQHQQHQHQAIHPPIQSQSHSQSQQYFPLLDTPSKLKLKRKPFKILLVRHGESIANINHAAYEETPEHRIPLSHDGKTMARGTGNAITKYFQEVFGSPENSGRIRMWYSPYVRTWQTAQCIYDCCGNWITDMKEHPMLAELDYGLFEGNGRTYANEFGYKRELEHYNSRAQHSGRFWARFPMGESPFDVCIRMQLFFGTLARGRDLTKYSNRNGTIDTVIIVTHGVTMRAFVKMWAHKSQDWYENEWNPNNCAVRLITESAGDEWFIFNGYDSTSPSVEADGPYSSAKTSVKVKGKGRSMRLSSNFSNPINKNSQSGIYGGPNGVSEYKNPNISKFRKVQLGGGHGLNKHDQSCTEDTEASSTDEDTDLEAEDRKS